MGKIRKHSILSFDGGGSWAVLQIHVLQYLYGDIPGLEILKNFDTVIANSGGSIVLGGLLKNLKPSEICDFFYNRDIRKTIYSKLGFFESPKNWFLRGARVGAQYSAARKLKAFEALFTIPGSGSEQPYIQKELPDLVEYIKKEHKLDTFPDIIIMGYDYDTKRAKFFRSNRNSKAASKGPKSFVPLTDAIHVSTNAPILYFDKPAELAKYPGRRFWDGAIAAYNNPLLAGLTEAISNNVAPGRIEALSIGTGSIRLPVIGQDNNCVSPELELTKKKPGFLADLRKISTAIMDDPMDSATYMSYVWLTNGMVTNTKDKNEPVTTGPLVRLNPLISPVLNKDGCWDYPGWDLKDERSEWLKENFTKIVTLPMDAAKDVDVKLLTKLWEYWKSDIILNQPIRFNNNGRLNIEIGHSKFTEAAAKWRKMKGLKEPEEKKAEE